MKIKDYGNFDVTEDRSLYIGGSDIPAIMGISPFKRRYDLLLEKAGLQDNSFHGSRYTEYGHVIEPQIRSYVNATFGRSFAPNRVIDGDFRYHSDGCDVGWVLECKSTSTIHKTVDGYRMYLVQLIKGMEMNDVENGILAVYDRPEDMSPVFDPNRLQVFQISMSQYTGLLREVNAELDRFRSDLAKIRENPLLSEEDFLPASSAIAELSNKVVMFESQLAKIKEIENRCKEAKKQLYEEMCKYSVKQLETPNGTKISLVEEIPSKAELVSAFNESAFADEHPKLYKQYVTKVEKKTAGKSGYVRITLPKA